jgi:hypothetical protein
MDLLTRTNYRINLLFAFLFSIALGACGSIDVLTPPTPTPYPPRMELGSLPEAYRENSLVVSDDGLHFAYVVTQAGSGEAVVQDGVQGSTYQQIGNLYLSPQTNRLFYWALSGSGTQQKIVLFADGTEYASGCAGEGWLGFSADGKRWYALCGLASTNEGNAIKAGDVVLLVDGVEVGRYPDASAVEFDPSGKHYALIVKNAQSKIALVVDGKEQTVYEEPTEDTSTLIQLAVVGPNLPLLFKARYLSDGQLVVLTREKNGWTVFKGDTPLASYRCNYLGGGDMQVIVPVQCQKYASIVAFSLTKAENAPVAVWWERLDGTEDVFRVIKDGSPVDENTCAFFDRNLRPAVSPDGKRTAYACALPTGETEAQPMAVVVNGTKQGNYQNIWGISFSKDSQHIAYAASDGKSWTIYHDGQPIPSQLNLDGSIWSPVLSEDGAHVAWTAEAADKIQLVLDGIALGVAEEIAWGPRFEASGTVAWVIREGNKIVRLTFPLNQKPTD